MRAIASHVTLYHSTTTQAPQVHISGTKLDAQFVTPESGRILAGHTVGVTTAGNDQSETLSTTAAAAAAGRVAEPCVVVLHVKVK